MKQQIMKRAMNETQFETVPPFACQMNMIRDWSNEWKQFEVVSAFLLQNDVFWWSKSLKRFPPFALQNEIAFWVRN